MGWTWKKQHFESLGMAITNARYARREKGPDEIGMPQDKYHKKLVPEMMTLKQIRQEVCRDADDVTIICNKGCMCFRECEYGKRYVELTEGINCGA